MRRRTWLIRVGLAFTFVGALWFAAREVRDSINKRCAFAVVDELGGNYGSIPCWPGGDEIRIEFNGSQLSNKDVLRLAVLNPLNDRHWVGIMFKDTNVSQEDVLQLRRLLPGSVVFRVVDGQMLEE